jgi:hypothetical protein
MFRIDGDWVVDATMAGKTDKSNLLKKYIPNINIY